MVRLRLDTTAVTQALDSIASVLESTGEYRVLRRVSPFVECADPPSEPTFIGLILDTETTGFDHARDEVIELGIIKFEYGASGRVYRVLEMLNQLHHLNSRPAVMSRRRSQSSTRGRWEVVLSRLPCSTARSAMPLDLASR